MKYKITLENVISFIREFVRLIREAPTGHVTDVRISVRCDTFRTVVRKLREGGASSYSGSQRDLSRDP